MQSAHFGVAASNGELWVSGDRGTIWKYSVGTELKLAGGPDAQGRFRLTIKAPVAGNYRVYSTGDVTGSSWTPREVVAVTNQAIWTETSATGAVRLYMV